MSIEKKEGSPEFPLNVDYNRSLKDLIKQGDFKSVDFSEQGSPKLDMFIVNLEPNKVPTDEELQASLDESGLRLATHEEYEAFTEQYPDQEVQDPDEVQTGGKILTVKK